MLRVRNDVIPHAQWESYGEMSLVEGIQLLVDDFRQDVSDRDVGLLDTLGIVGGNHDRDVHESGEFSAPSPGESDAGDSDFSRSIHALQDVRGITRRGNRKGDIAFSTVCRDQPGKHRIESIVIRDRGEIRSVRSEGQRRKRGPLPREMSAPLRGDVLRIRRRAPVSEQKGFPTAPKALDERLRSPGDRR